MQQDPPPALVIALPPQPAHGPAPTGSLTPLASPEDLQVSSQAADRMLPTRDRFPKLSESQQYELMDQYSDLTIVNDINVDAARKSVDDKKKKKAAEKKMEPKKKEEAQKKATKRRRTSETEEQEIVTVSD